MMAKKTKRLKKKKLNRLRAYTPIVRLLSQGGGKLQKSILTVLPEPGLDVVCECLHNALHSCFVRGESLKKLWTVEDPDSICRLASTTVDSRKRRKDLVAKSEDVARALSSVYPILKRVVTKKKKTK